MTENFFSPIYKPLLSQADSPPPDSGLADTLDTDQVLFAEQIDSRVETLSSMDLQVKHMI